MVAIDNSNNLISTELVQFQMVFDTNVVSLDISVTGT